MCIDLTSRIMNPPITGKLIIVGTFPVRDEEITGYVIQSTEAEIAAQKTLPMYRRVVIVPVEDYEHLTRYCSELEERMDAFGLKAAQGAVDITGRFKKPAVDAPMNPQPPKVKPKADDDDSPSAGNYWDR